MIEHETFEHAGRKIRVGYEEDAEHANPRECDNVTLFYCWHPSYVLGDEQFGRGDHDSMEEVERYLREERGAVGPILPLYLLDHSGLSLSVGRPSAFDPGGWDTTMVGFACCTEEGIAKCCGDGAEYRADEWVEKAIRDDVRAYDAYLRGSVYWYLVENADGEVVGSCGGFLVVDEADMEHLRGQAREDAELDARDEAAHAEPDVEAAIREATR